jgi:hypothetical protein
MVYSIHLILTVNDIHQGQERTQKTRQWYDEKTDPLRHKTEGIPSEQ